MSHLEFQRSLPKRFQKRLRTLMHTVIRDGADSPEQIVAAAIQSADEQRQFAEATLAALRSDPWGAQSLAAHCLREHQLHRENSRWHMAGKEATERQILMLRRFGVSEAEINSMDRCDASDRIDRLRRARKGTGRG